MKNTIFNKTEFRRDEH